MTSETRLVCDVQVKDIPVSVRQDGFDLARVSRGAVGIIRGRHGAWALGPLRLFTVCDAIVYPFPEVSNG